MTPRGFRLRPKGCRSKSLPGVTALENQMHHVSKSHTKQLEVYSPPKPRQTRTVARSSETRQSKTRAFARANRSASDPLTSTSTFSRNACTSICLPISSSRLIRSLSFT